MAEPAEEIVAVLQHRTPSRRLLMVLLVAALTGAFGAGYKAGFTVGDETNKQLTREQVACILTIELIPEAQRQALTPDELRRLCPVSLPMPTLDTATPTTIAATPSEPAATTSSVAAPAQHPATTKRPTVPPPTLPTRPPAPSTPAGPSPSPSPAPPSPPDDLTDIIGMVCALPVSANRPLCEVHAT